jgi:hypothetical protein
LTRNRSRFFISKSARNCFPHRPAGDAKEQFNRRLTDQHFSATDRFNLRARAASNAFNGANKIIDNVQRATCPAPPV